MYQISSTYCWYSDWLNKNEKIVLMYFINGIPFTWDELVDVGTEEEDVLLIANNERKYNTEEIYNYYTYLMEEEFNPLVYEMELENPEELPLDQYEYGDEDLPN
tara:strand:- start:42 stop:353 length:312 start_codon:yes stop_codon:yes gene_type:complete